MIDYKNTLNLPATSFPMRGNLAHSEPIILQRWHKHDLYSIIRQFKKGKKVFILHDGPPYANGNIHIGHAVNKILKDIIIKSKGLMGYDAPYIPGWDCHGLPIELQVEQIVGKPDEKVSSAEFRIACRLYATSQVERQKKDFVRLGVLGDWQHPYLTMNFSTEANIIRTLGKIIANGHLYKGVKPVHWCLDCRSALAEAEVEYCNRTSSAIYVTFLAHDVRAVASRFNIKGVLNQISLVIWTTTPWTLPANRGIAVHPNFTYQLVEVNGQGYILAANLVETVMTRAGVTKWKVCGNTKGIELELLRFFHPFMQFDVPVILSSHVTMDIGTGAVHTAPSHGQDDYLISKPYDLEITNYVGADGCYVEGTLPDLDGLQVFKANKVVIRLLHNSGSLLHEEELQHSYPHCWRHRTPIIFRATPQWFISMDQCGLRQQVLSEINAVQWLPEWGQARIKSMIMNRPDWCISRQRSWGVPIVLFIHNETQELHPRTIDLIEIVARRVEIDGIQAWWDFKLNEILGEEDAKHYHKVIDTLDVWFDSGSTHASVVAVRPEFEGHQPDMYLEGSDQHRGWFMSSLMISTAMHGKAPYSQVLTHGFTVDGHGRKMSKSLGNIIKPEEIIDKLGADILRFWVASTDYASEISISDEILKRSVDSYRRIRNTARFLLANLNGFNPELHSIKMEEMVMLDRWAVGCAQMAQAEIIAAYNICDFHNVIHRVMQFCSIDMGSFYLDIIKDRQYTAKSDSVARRSCQTALYHIIEAMVRWIAPIISFTADEIWSFIPGKRSQYVFTEEWYNGLFGLDPAQPLNNSYWHTLLQVRNETNKVIEYMRTKKIIGSSLEACITLYADPDLSALLHKLEGELYFALLTSNAIVADYNDAGDNAINCVGLKGLKIGLIKAKGKKCSRCWHYEEDIGKCDKYPEICSRCIINVYGSGEIRKFV